jgi:hypothetical protein
MKLAIILAEFGRPAPDVSQYRKCWPEADIQVRLGDKDNWIVPELEPTHPRYGWRWNDYFKVKMMLESGADIAMCFDSDMRIVDFNGARTLPLLAERFGLCLPINPRYTVWRDFCDGADTGNFRQDIKTGPGVNCSPIAIDLRRKLWSSELGTRCAEAYCQVMLETPMRGPLAWCESMWSIGYSPLILPPQFCVCERHIGVGDEIILHTGHAAVERHYAKMEAK